MSPVSTSAVAAAKSAPAQLHSEFDVCHAGVALRSLLLVHGAVAVGLMFHGDTLADWLMLVSLAFVLVLPATLAWLSMACLGQPWLLRLSRVWRWAAALAAGALCGVAVAVAWTALRDGLLAQSGLLGPRGASDAMVILGAATSGAALSAVIFYWMVQRIRLLGAPTTLARLAELQSRIRPHFLFNALNSAIALVGVRPELAESVLEDLAELFRAALDETRGQVTLADELTLAHRYLAIEQVRFGDRLMVDWRVESSVIARVQVPPLVLQPLVENAVKHGIESGADPAEVVVEVRRLDARQACVLIRNRLPAAPTRPPVAGLGMALTNVQERLRLMHDVALRFESGPTADGWWQVRIVLPLQAGQGAL